MQSSCFWVITDQLPYPPRNGITLPLFNYLSLLRKDFTVRLLLLVDVESPPAASALRANEDLFGAITLINVERKPKVVRLVSEIFRREMYQHGWQPVANTMTPAIDAADVILVSPMSAVAKWQTLMQMLPIKSAVQIAAVNDCTAAEYFNRGLSTTSDWREQLKGKLDRLRASNIGRIEARLLDGYDHVLLQTAADREFMATLVSPKIADKVRLVPNGVSESYLNLATTPQGNIVFVGELSGEYAATARWLLTAVWPPIAEKYPQLTLVIVGKGASANLRELIAAGPRVEHIEYIPRLEDVYATATIALSPVFKGFGLINKTLEAMASGIPVVGGAAAFNGIAGFEAGIHGVTCAPASAVAFVEALEQLLDAPEVRKKMGAQARALVSAQFRWNNAALAINELVVGYNRIQSRVEP